MKQVTRNAKTGRFEKMSLLLKHGVDDQALHVALLAFSLQACTLIALSCLT